MSLPPNGPALRAGNFSYLTAFDGETKEARVVEGHLFVCKGCCCGATEKGNPEVPLPRFKHEWKVRNMRHRVHLSVSACLGPCVGVNVAIGLGFTFGLVALAGAGVLGAEAPIIAALLHNLSTFLGIGNAGRLLRFDETSVGTGAQLEPATT